ncbi:MAG: NADH-ubiquinone oxidoreductase subunit NDUFA12 family protein [Geminicoccaceae bacterium]
MFGTNSFFTLFKTWLSGELVGEDAYGNRYYREKKPEAGRRERRWVVYSKVPEPTRVPPGWVGWLHGRIKEPPSDAPLPSPHFEMEPQPNLTGTTEAYLPPGAVQRGGVRAPAPRDSETCRPE